MNKLASSIPNKIKQPSLCCVYCGKSYIKRVNLDKHLVICELLQKTKTKTSINPIIDSLYNDVEEPIPTQRKMFQMLIELGERYSRLEGKVDELNKWVVKKKKKINILGWLNANMKPNIVFETMIDKIVVTEDDIKKLLEQHLNPCGGFINVQSRWCKDDTTGFLTEVCEYHKWKVLKYPDLNICNEPLTNRFEYNKNNLYEPYFQTLFMQEPVL